MSAKTCRFQITPFLHRIDDKIKVTIEWLIKDTCWIIWVPPNFSFRFDSNSDEAGFTVGQKSARFKPHDRRRLVVIDDRHVKNVGAIVFDCFAETTEIYFNIDVLLIIDIIILIGSDGAYARCLSGLDRYISWSAEIS